MDFQLARKHMVDSQVRPISKLLEGAALKPTDLVLDIGCGTGYSTAILSRLCEMVVAIEPDEALNAAAQENLTALKIDNNAVLQAPLEAGMPDQGPYDFIFIGAAIARKPEALLSQLRDGGRLVTIFRGDLAKENAGSRRGVLYTRQNSASGDVFTRIDLFDAGSREILDVFKAEKKFEF